MAGANEFRRDGACVVRGLLDDAEVARLRDGVERNLAEPSERAIEGGESGAGRFFEDFRNWTRMPEYEEVIRDSRLGEVAAQLMDSHTVRLHHRIYAAIKKGDAGEARARMFTHLTDAKELLIRSSAARKQAELGDRLSALSLPQRPQEPRRPNGR